MFIYDESQQSMKFEFLVPQTQFIDDVWTFSLCNDRYVVFWCRKLWSFRSCSSSLAVRSAEADLHGPVCSADHGDFAVAAFLVVYVPVVLGRAGSQVLPWRRRSCSHSFSSLRSRRPLNPTTGAENCGVSAVAVHDDRRFPCRGAEAVSCGLAVQQTVEILVLNLNTVIDVPVAQVVQVPSYSAVTCSVFAFRVQDSGLFWVMTSGNVPVFSALGFNTGYMSTSVYGGLVSLVPRSCRQRQLVFAGVDALRTMFPSLFSGPDVLHHGAVSRGPASLADHRGFAVAVRAGWSMSGMQSCRFLCSCSSSTWSSSPLSLRRVYPMVQTVVKPGNPQLLYKVVDFPVSWSCRFTSPSWRRGCFLLVQTARRTIETSQLQYASDG